jgi:hypothetical protein
MIKSIIFYSTSPFLVKNESCCDSLTGCECRLLSSPSGVRPCQPVKGVQKLPQSRSGCAMSAHYCYIKKSIIFCVYYSIVFHIVIFIIGFLEHSDFNSSVVLTKRDYGLLCCKKKIEK